VCDGFRIKDPMQRPVTDMKLRTLPSLNNEVKELMPLSYIDLVDDMVLWT
jgi:hypothetical protein